MKIAIIAQVHNPVSPAFPGGVEVLNYNLSDELKKRGHDVTLFASGDSKTKAKLYPICKQSLFSIKTIEEPQVMRKTIYQENRSYINAIEYIKQNGYDIIHQSHSSFLPVYLASILKIPQILTLHLTANSNITLNQDLKEVPYMNKIPLVSISKYQAKLLKGMNFYANVYNGLPIEDFDFSDSAKGYFAWLGRIAPNKGTLEAIKIARLAKIKLKIAGGLGVGEVIAKYFAKIEKYFNDATIKYLGQVGAAERNLLLKYAKAVILPIQWEEPFGLVTIEAMACGTPVVAFARGSMPELVRDGETGFIVNPSSSDKRGNWVIKKTGIEGMVEAVNKIDEMPKTNYQKMRAACRKHVEQNFTVEKMVDGYEKVYQKVISELKKN